jgi:Rrf2 family protein
MLTISRETDYAARVLLYLARQPAGQRATAQQIAGECLIPRGMVRRVVTRLGVAGLVATTRGSDGGIALARPAGQISLLDVVEAMEGPLALNACTVDPGICPLIPTCPVHDVWGVARQELRAMLARSTFDRLAQKGELADRISE